jgi:hypothetical protein
MKRFLKQLVYGILYLSVFSGIGIAVYYNFFIPEQTCFDNIKNQNEEALDCGGVCESCELKTLNLISGEAKAFSAGKLKSNILVRIENPSSNYFLQNFDYEFGVFSGLGPKLFSINNKSSILPKEVKYIVVSGIDTDYHDIGKVVFKPVNQNWEPVSKLANYDFKTNGLKVGISGGYTEVEGEFENVSSLNFSSIRATAVIFTKAGTVLNGGTTELNGIKAFGKTPFKIYLPYLPEITAKMDTAKTKVFYEIIKN